MHIKFTSFITGLLLSLHVAAQESAVTIFINGLDGAAKDVEQLAQSMQIPFSSQMVDAMLGGVIMNPSFTGINKDGLFTAFIGADLEDGRKAPMAFVIPLSDDGSSYIDTLKKTLPTHVKKSETLHQFVMPASGAAKPTEFIVKILKGNKALIGINMAHMSSLTKSLNRDDLAVVKTLPGKIAFSINTDLMRKAISKQLEGQKQILEMVKDQRDELQSTDALGLQMDPAAMIDSYDSLMNNLFSQFKSFIIGLNFENEISLNMYASALEGTALAETIKNAEAPDQQVKALADPNNSLLNAWGNMKGVSPLMEMYMNWVKDLYTSMGPQYEGLTHLFDDESMAEMYKIYEGYSFKMLAPTKDHSLRMIGAYEVSDVEKAKAWNKKYIGDINKAMLGVDPDDKDAVYMKITESEPVEENGLEITEYAFAMNFPAPENNPGQPNMDIFNNMKYYQAYQGDYLIYAMGEKALLFEAANKLAKAPEAGSTDSELLSEWMVDYGKIFKAFMGTLTPTGQPNPVAGILIESIRLAGSSKKQGEGIVSNIKITKEAIQTVMMSVMMMQQPQSVTGIEVETVETDSLPQ